MRSIQVKSVILGIGIGIILTSFIGMIFSSGMEKAAILDDEYVIRRAIELGIYLPHAVFNPVLRCCCLLLLLNLIFVHFRAIYF
jgi:hypothetical protein